MNFKIRIWCLIIHLYAKAINVSARLYKLDDADCKIRFYKLPNYQGSSWTYDGMQWHYAEDCHKYSCSGIIPNRNKFDAESIRTFANKPADCETWVICSKKRTRRRRKSMSCENLPPEANAYPDIRRWDIGRHKIEQWTISVTKVSSTKRPVRITYPTTKAEKMIGKIYTCNGKNCRHTGIKAMEI